MNQENKGKIDPLFSPNPDPDLHVEIIAVEPVSVVPMSRDQFREANRGYFEILAKYMGRERAEKAWKLI
ncbi:hypothetical protein HYW46_02535 [Candidatus Daviesbacteria bacterium]|nr:hypothetical protein [Candidatus Daviesbacteria bacterium]